VGTAKAYYSSSYPLCPKNCLLTDDVGQALDASPIGVTFQEIELGGQVTIKTGNFDLNYQSFDMTVTCYSAKSQADGGQPSTIISPFNLVYATECYSAPIIPAQMQSYSIFLYGEDVRFANAPAEVNPNCGPIFYELRQIAARTNAV